MPYHRFDFVNTVSSSATSGSVTLTASGATFSAGHVGSHIYVNGGDVTITGYTSPTVLTGTVTGSMTTTAADTTWKEWAWSAARGYPRTATFHQNRLVFGGTRDAPETIFGSVNADFYNMDDSTVSGATITDSSGYSFTLSTDTVEIIREIRSQLDLNIWTSEGEHQLNSGASGGSVTATNVNVDVQSRYGISNIRVVSVEGESIFVTANQKEVRSYVYQFATNRYVSDNKTSLVHHLFVDDKYPVDMAYLRSYKDTQSNFIFIPRQDGEMAICSINVAREVLAWGRWITKGSFKRVCVAVADHGNGVPIETLFAVVSRDNGVCLEALTEEDRFVDCYYTGTSVTPKTTWTGSTALENEVVQVVGDGLVMPDATVSNTGSVTVGTPVSDIVLGLEYDSTMVTNKFIVAIDGANMRGARIRKIQVIVGLLNTKSLTIDGYPVSFRNFGSNLLDQPLPSYSGTKDIRAGGVSEDSVVTLTVEEPLPCTVLDVTTRLKVRVISINRLLSNSYVIDVLDRPALDYIWTHLRRQDREEVALQGLNDATYPVLLGIAHKWFCAVTEPMILFGAVETERCFWIVCLATDEIGRHMKTFTMIARPWLDMLRQQMFGKRAMVEVWEKHRRSVAWLRRLGFTDEAERMHGSERFIIMEYRG